MKPRVDHSNQNRELSSRQHLHVITKRFTIFPFYEIWSIFHHTLLSLKKMQIYDLFVKTWLFKDNTNDFIVKTYYNILIYYQPVLTLTSSLCLQPIGPTYHSVLTLSSNPCLHPICLTYQSVLTLTSSPRLQPISPTYLWMMSRP